MKKYVIKRFFSTLIIFVFIYFLSLLIQGEKLSKMDFSDSSATLIAVTIGAIFGILTLGRKLQRDYQEERERRDENFYRRRGKMTYSIVMALILAVPTAIIIAGFSGVEYISLRMLAAIILVVLLICFIFSDILDFK
ncbi:hypothetical protein [Listeria floridensis]|nr:hypothetical protein [Listeria floridensis]